MRLPAFVDTLRRNVLVSMVIAAAGRWSAHRASSKGAAPEVWPMTLR